MPNDIMQSDIRGVSICDSDETIPFYYMPEYSSAQNPTKDAASTPKTKCTFDIMGRVIHTHRRQLQQGNHLKLTPDELLANIKRQRWCYSCFNTACIQEDELQGKFFCSVECQLNYYDS